MAIPILVPQRMTRLYCSGNSSTEAGESSTRPNVGIRQKAEKNMKKVLKEFKIEKPHNGLKLTTLDELNSLIINE